VLATAASAAAQPPELAAPYEYLGWGEPQPPAQVIQETGVQAITLAFVLAHDGCNPEWEGSEPLLGGKDQAAIEAIRAAGAEVVVSIGGWSGKKLGSACKSAAALAAAYEDVITAYGLHAIDIDIEHTELSSAKARARVATALRLVQLAYPSLEISLTMPADEEGPEAASASLIADGAADHLVPYAWTIMPFDFGPPASDMATASIRATEGLARDIASSYGIGEREAYEEAGISTMNGKTDEKSETVTPANFETMLAFATAHHLARMTFWSVNRDRECHPARECSGIAQAPLQFTRLLAGYRG